MSRCGFYASYLLLPFDGLQMAAVVADAKQRVTSASEVEMNKILDGRDSKNTKNVIETP